MSSEKLRHRHVLLAPILALIVVVTASQGGELRASVEKEHIENENEETQVLHLSDHIQVVLFRGATLDQSEGVRVEGGQALLSGRGLIKVDAGPFHLMSIAGAFHVTVRDQVVTVAAISAPVLVQWEEQVVLVPVGLQWRGRGKLVNLQEGTEAWFTARELKTVPVAFRLEQLTRLSSLTEDSSDTPSLNIAFLSESIGMYMEPLQLPAARERAQERIADVLLKQVAMYAAKGDREGAHDLLILEEAEDALKSDRGVQALIKLLPESSDDPLLIRDVLTLLLQDARVWFLLSMHPDYRESVWGLGRPDLTEEQYFVHLITFPQSDILPEGLPSYVLERWQLNLSDAAESMEDPSAFLAHLLDLLTTLIRSYNQNDYPQRAALLTHLLLELSDLHPGVISDEQRTQLHELKNFDRVDVSLLETAEELVEEYPEEKPEPRLTPDQVKAQTYELLRSVGALFTVNTKIEPISPTVASVEHLLFSSPDSERELDFKLDVISGTVFDVEQDGVVLPFSLPMEEFAEWARK
ncbi:MAG: hypothetical protein ABIA92_05090 [Patescibacteria group bacterium]